MHVPTLLRKCAFSFTGVIALSDHVRNFAYRWAWSHLGKLPRGSLVCDIGSRDSLFPAFLAWQGYTVTVVEKDQRFIETLSSISRRWSAPYDLKTQDFLTSAFTVRVNAVLSLFSLQHAGEQDIPAYRKAAGLLRQCGLFLSVCEYDHRQTRMQHDRDDGAMRIYGPRDIEDRIEKPLIEGGVEIMEKRFAGWNKAAKRLHWKNPADTAGFCFLCGKKNRD